MVPRLQAELLLGVEEITCPLKALRSMDNELKQHLDAMEGRMNIHVDQRVRESENRVATLITEVKESLERQMNHRFDGLDARFEAQANRLDRQGALIQTG